MSCCNPRGGNADVLRKVCRCIWRAGDGWGRWNAGSGSLGGIVRELDGKGPAHDVSCSDFTALICGLLSGLLGLLSRLLTGLVITIGLAVFNAHASDDRENAQGSEYVRDGLAGEFAPLMPPPPGARTRLAIYDKAIGNVFPDCDCFSSQTT